ncbi:MAG: EF-hand domain-containing protein [Cellvibrionaceae bacterium]
MQKLITVLAAMALSSAVLANNSDIRKVGAGFEDLDNDGDLYISREEADDNSVADHFARMDTDGDDRISQPEFHEFLTANPGLAEEDVVEEVRDDTASPAR